MLIHRFYDYFFVGYILIFISSNPIQTKFSFILLFIDFEAGENMLFSFLCFSLQLDSNCKFFSRNIPLVLCALLYRSRQSDGSTFRNVCNEIEVSVVQLCFLPSTKVSLWSKSNRCWCGYALFYNIETCFK